ncbi:MAG TPA: hypothetical protein VFU46_00725 [Gemmatimonadales bacterium]|nr:hypothetical protein [Gemmatimonadales bacterium]
MAERTLIFRGTPPIDPLNALALLESPFHAVWFPPDARLTTPAEGDRVWLVWHDGGPGPALLLGTGRLKAAGDGELRWTNRTAPGIRELARQFGYKGPGNMAFLRLERPRIAPANCTLPGLGTVPPGLSEATEPQRRLLESALPLVDRRSNRLRLP